jgi:two-component system, OmpR family, response regulator
MHRPTLTLLMSESVARRRIAATLAGAGHNYFVVDSIERARARLADGGVALVAMELDPDRSADVTFAREVAGSAALIVLLDRPQTVERLLALGLHGDDYVLKPFASAEVKARIAAALARRQSRPTETEPSAVLAFSGWRLDLAAKMLADPFGRDVPITPAEFRLLAALAQRRGRVQSREQLLDAVAGRTAASFDRTIDVLVGRLRSKIEADRKAPRLILTVPRFGYKLAADAPGSTPPAHFVPPRVDTQRPNGVVILPLTTDVADATQEAAATCVTQDLIACLARSTHQPVIVGSHDARRIASKLGLRRLGRDLHVRYVVSGRIRWLGSTTHISVHLADTSIGRHLWTEWAALDETRSVVARDAAVVRIATILASRLAIVEGLRAELAETQDPESLIARGRATALEANSRDMRQAALRFFERALKLDDRSVEAVTGLGMQLALYVADRWSENPAHDLRRAEAVMQRAQLAAPDSRETHVGLGLVLRRLGRPEEAVAMLRAAVEIDPLDGSKFMTLGTSLMYAGRAKEALPLIERSAELDGSPNSRAWALWNKGACCQSLGQTREALDYLLGARAANPNLAYVRIRLAAAFGEIGEIDEARRELVAARSGGDYPTLAALAGEPQMQHPDFRAQCEPTFYAGLRRAGMAER